MQSYFKTNPKSFVESQEDVISKVARQEMIVDKVKKLCKYWTIKIITNIIIFYSSKDNNEKRGINEK